MIIIILNSLPFTNTSIAIKESINECVLVFVGYHLVLVTDFVPDFELEIKKYNSYSLISLIALTIVVYMFFIVKPLVSSILKILK